MTEQWERFYKGVSTTRSVRWQAELWLRLMVETDYKTEWKEEAWLLAGAGTARKAHWSWETGQTVAREKKESDLCDRHRQPMLKPNPL